MPLDPAMMLFKPATLTLVVDPFVCARFVKKMSVP